MTTFSELGLPAAIGAAIAEKKFEQPTRVQAAVMDPGLRGRDLLVSAETGSGKTLAFGSVLARELLEGTATERPAGGRKIRALVIAPTRELATQVRGELSWLFAKTGWRIGSFTGGTDVWGDLRTLKTGVDVVVGTPGRLVDLVSRQSLSLADVEAVVLDEADEMLDMGFREDLEKLLVQASARRLTLLFSATLPADILRLAKRYQKDAARVDTRQGGSAPHADIAYVAYLTPVGEKLAAVMNVLRVHDAKRAIVFGTTREGVADLHEALARRGVRAVVLSGDRSQADRDRSLAALKRGEARVLVATNVAARGLDLPEVDLVIHADLPSNVEALTHRSGRTGRAGRKGTSALIAQLTERRKAERLIGMAKLKISWQNAPGAAEVAAHAEQGLRRELAQELGLASSSEGGEEAATDEAPAIDPRAAERSRRFLAELEAQGTFDARALLEALLRRELARLPEGDRLSAVSLPSEGVRERPVGATAAERRERFSQGTVAFRVNIGVRQNGEPGWLLPLICKRGGVTRKEVGAIRVGPHDTTFEIARDAAEAFARAAAVPDPRALQVKIERLEGAGAAPAPAKPRARAPRMTEAREVAPTREVAEAREAAPTREVAEARETGEPRAVAEAREAAAPAETPAAPKRAKVAASSPEVSQAPAFEEAPAPKPVPAKAPKSASPKAPSKASSTPRPRPERSTDDEPSFKPAPRAFQPERAPRPASGPRASFTPKPRPASGARDAFTSAPRPAFGARPSFTPAPRPASGARASFTPKPRPGQERRPAPPLFASNGARTRFGSSDRAGSSSEGRPIFTPRPAPPKQGGFRPLSRGTSGGAGASDGGHRPFKKGPSPRRP